MLKLIFLPSLTKRKRFSPVVVFFNLQNSEFVDDSGSVVSVGESDDFSVDEDVVGRTLDFSHRILDWYHAEVDQHL
jgi:hypothetical protein